jgi:dolichol-phosphate mannosyltransferase/undecaprenyl-phosphate 4-deoxy-4-formamido-L-arabinose transferase
MGGIGVPGWTTVVVLVCFFSGIILLSMGIFGEYMVRILREVRGAPRYVERERLGRSLSDREPE